MKKKKAALSPEDALKKAVSELDASLPTEEVETEETEEQTEETTESSESLIKSLTTAINGLLKKSQATTEESEEESEDSEEEESETQDAVSKAKACDEDEDDEEEDEEEAPQKPAFFQKKKGKKPVKKSIADDEDESEETEAADVTEFLENMDSRVNDLSKSIAQIQDGLVAFGELLVEQANPDKEKVLVSLSKAVTHLVKENAEMKKAMAPLFKSMPAVPTPKVVGTRPVEKIEKSQKAMSQEDQNRLFKAAASGKITGAEMTKAIAENDQTIFEKFK
ncbi:MAG: hypothetical protein ACXVCY_04225 [Pseudobdellovibrionaceae bacterium]